MAEKAFNRDDPMQIFYRNLPGKSIIINVKPSDTIKSVKDKIKKNEGIPIKHQRLIFAGKLLKNGKTLAEYNIRKIATLFLKLSIQGS